MKRSLNLHHPNVVAAVDSAASLNAALRLKPHTVDLLELRVDAFASDPAPLLRAAPDFQFPLLITVRHPLEGGVHSLTLSERRDLFTQFLPHASAVDIELRSIEKLGSVAAAASSEDVALILSSHHFQNTPSAIRLHELARRALLGSADIFKLATWTDRTADVATLLSFFEQQKRIPLSVMGMGRFGRVSRLLFAQAGSVLNYGYLERPVASGQWPATELKKRIGELLDPEKPGI